MDFKQIIDRAKAVREKYGLLEIKKYGRKWAKEEIALGFVGDVGDLMKLVTAKAGVRDIKDIDAKMAHEFSDCLWSIIVLSDQYGIDLEKSFTETMNELEKKMK